MSPWLFTNSLLIILFLSVYCIYIFKFQPSTEASLRSASDLKNRQRSTSECSETQPQPPPRKQKKQKKSVDIKSGLHRSLSESNVIASLRYGREQPLEVKSFK